MLMKCEPFFLLFVLPVILYRTRVRKLNAFSVLFLGNPWFSRQTLCISKLILKTYDYIFTGGGCAALCTAYELHQQGLGGQSVLIIDRDSKDTNDRTWCYWTRGIHPFPEVVQRVWSRLSFKDYRGEVNSKMGDYEYAMIRSADLYHFIKSRLRENPQIHFLQAEVESICPLEQGAQICAGGEWYRAGKVLNSIYDPRQLRPQANEYLLYQHFKGWWIESDTPVFDPDKATLMDFRTPQRGDGRFFYVLPMSQREALVEYTIFSDRLLESGEYDFRLKKYIGEQLGLPEYRVKEEEFGVIPMTNARFPQHSSPHILDIGTAGGAVKPTTGYAFLNIVRQSKELAQALLGANDTLAERSSAGRFRFYDHLLLHILQREGFQAAGIFSALFRHNPMHRILTFLNERSNLKQEVMIFAQLPMLPFLHALVQRWVAQVKISLESWGNKHPSVRKKRRKVTFSGMIAKLF